MGTFSPETCLELVPQLTRFQVDREYLYFGGTIELATKDKRYKLREYLCNLRDQNKEPQQQPPPPAAVPAAVPEAYNTNSVAYEVTDTTAYKTPATYNAQASTETETQHLQNICQEINSNVNQLKFEFEEYLSRRRGDGGCYDTVDMDLSDPGDDMELSDCEMSQKSDEKLTRPVALKPAVKGHVIVLNPDHVYNQRGGPSNRGTYGASMQRGVGAGRGGAPPSRGPARGSLYASHQPSANGSYQDYNPAASSYPATYSKQQPATRAQQPATRVRGINRPNRFAARGGSQPKRVFGVRGLGNKEEIPHDLKPVDWAALDLEAVNKVIYNENSAVAQRTIQEVEEYRKQHKMLVSEDCPNPILTFDEVSYPAGIMQIIYQSNFKAPTPIQAQGWPIALQGQDLIGIAQTGSGKTLAFTIPGIIHINAQAPQNDGPVALCLCPTRELAQQVMGVIEQYTQPMRIRAVCLYGGSSKAHQVRQLSQGVEFAVATPGRLIDLLNTGKISLRRCSYLVLDEADRMLDMGFEPQITAIISQIRPDRQTLMWSATWPREVQELARVFLNKPMQITIGSDKLVANHDIKQVVQVIEDFEKFDKLKILLQQIYDQGIRNKTLVFTDTKRMADDIAAELQRMGWPVEAMHGDKRQEERERILREFKRSRITILVATDVASRGIDISDISNVINFDYPNTAEDYIHRIGRTARAQRKGTAYTFITPNDSRNIDDLVDVLTEANQEIPHALLMMKECFGGSKPDKKVWAPKGAKRRQEGQARAQEAAKRRSTADADADTKPMLAWDDNAEKEDSDSDVEVRKRQNWPETDDDWKALYGDMGDTGPGDTEPGDTGPGERRNNKSDEVIEILDTVADIISVEDTVVDPIDWKSLENG